MQVELARLQESIQSAYEAEARYKSQLDEDLKKQTELFSVRGQCALPMLTLTA